MNAQADSGRPDFASQVSGRHSKAIDQTLARLNADVYDAQGSTIEGWKPLDAAQLESAGIKPTLLTNTQTGFAARIYTNDQGHYALVFRGTDEAIDWRHNVRQGLGFVDRQYEEAIALANKAHEAFGANLVLTGHSLGGGLAAAASLSTKAPAVTFNAAGLHDDTIERMGLDPAEVRLEVEQGLIRRYTVDNEILTRLQEDQIPTRWLLPDAIGHRIRLPDPDPPSLLERLVPGSSLRHGVDVHGMDAVIEAQRLAQPSLGDARHPGTELYHQALHGLRRIDPPSLNFDVEPQYRNAAAALAAHAHANGLRRIDHVVTGMQGATLFAVEGRLDDPAHRVVHVDKLHAAAQSLEHSSQQLQSRAHVERVENEQRRPVISH